MVNIAEELVPLPDSSPFKSLSTSIRGRVVLPTDSDYFHLLKDGTFNLAQDAKPAALVLVAGTADVSNTIKWVRSSSNPNPKLEITVSGGRHTLKGMKDGALAIDLRPMRGAVVDLEKKVVHVQGGAKLGDLDGETAQWKMAAVAGSDPRTGVGGYLLGGGYGWLSRHYGGLGAKHAIQCGVGFTTDVPMPTGMAADNMVEAEVVLADGSVVVCSETKEPDLFFAIRGAGASFGVVTRFTLKLYEHPVLIHAQMQLYPIDQMKNSLVLLRDHLERKAFDNHSVNSMWEVNHTFPRRTPNGGWTERRPFVQLLPVYMGVDKSKSAEQHAQDARVALADVTDALPVKPFSTAPDPHISYIDLQNIMKPHIPPSHRTEMAFFIPSLPDDLISTLCDSFRKAPCPGAAMIAFPVGGAIGSLDPGATAFPWRLKRGYWFLVMASTFDYPDDRARVERERGMLAKWVSETGDVVRKWAVGSFVNRIGSGATNVKGEGKDSTGFDAALVGFQALASSRSPTFDLISYSFPSHRTFSVKTLSVSSNSRRNTTRRACFPTRIPVPSCKLSSRSRQTTSRPTRAPTNFEPRIECN